MISPANFNLNTNPNIIENLKQQIEKRYINTRLMNNVKLNTILSSIYLRKYRDLLDHKYKLSDLSENITKQDLKHLIYANPRTPSQIFFVDNNIKSIDEINYIIILVQTMLDVTDINKFHPKAIISIPYEHSEMIYISDKNLVNKLNKLNAAINIPLAMALDINYISVVSKVKYTTLENTDLNFTPGQFNPWRSSNQKNQFLKIL